MTYLTCRNCYNRLQCKKCGKVAEDRDATLVLNRDIPPPIPKRYPKHWFFIVFSFMAIAIILAGIYTIYTYYTYTTSASYVLNSYCQALIQGNYSEAYANFSDKYTLTSDMTFNQFSKVVS